MMLIEMITELDEQILLAGEGEEPFLDRLILVHHLSRARRALVAAARLTDDQPIIDIPTGPRQLADDYTPKEHPQT